jgi:hypothetical protein
MSDNQPKVELRSVHSLLKMKFFIPSYQRGYRWGKTQIEDLLSDIWEYSKRVKSEGTKFAGDYYCLQPLVIKFRPDTGVWEIIDGQQRLTTILIIMKCLKTQLDALELSSFHISFDTRSQINDTFLDTLDNRDRDNNIDIFHMANAVDTIQSWFETHKTVGVEKMSWLQTLLYSDDTGPNTRFIWYEIPNNHDPIETFTRLNMGKIPLTNAELVRALFLGKSLNTDQSNHDATQLRIAENWNIIEHQLHRSDFWYFIHDDNNAPTSRIEFIFDQITQRYLSALNHYSRPAWSDDQHRIFHYFYDQFNPKIQTSTNPKSPEHKEKLWKDIRDLALTLDEWFNDRSLYHLVGFIQNQGKYEIHSLHTQSLQLHKSEFKHYLKKLIFETVFETNWPTDNSVLDIISDVIENTTYGTKKQQLRDILLLFNIATLELNQESNMRFPFNSYKTQKWDIEHINATASKPSRVEDQRAWLKIMVEFHRQNVPFFEEIRSNKELQKKFSDSKCLQDAGFDGQEPGFNLNIDTVINSHNFAELFDDLYVIIMSVFTDPTSSQDLDKIGNLTLLDQATNRSYQNAPYPLKREVVMEIDHKGIYVPLCTRNIFLKAYSNQLHNMLMWLDSDQDDYKNKIIETLVNFFRDDN